MKPYPNQKNNILAHLDTHRIRDTFSQKKQNCHKLSSLYKDRHPHTLLLIENDSHAKFCVCPALQKLSGVGVIKQDGQLLCNLGTSQDLVRS